eukprot:TRINITY_DN2803_c0_g1_i3.p1 TRINITY_DN2803_c0_g1~~TRINITY_DN2803_c0_g1_i3.p1  ORF type:complete len:166 (-),score=24.26 TRINITY_DN2803_c0_g1_i3:317-814(-)
MSRFLEALDQSEILPSSGKDWTFYRTSTAQSQDWTEPEHPPITELLGLTPSISDHKPISLVFEPPPPASLSKNAKPFRFHPDNKKLREALNSGCQILSKNPDPEEAILMLKEFTQAITKKVRKIRYTSTAKERQEYYNRHLPNEEIPKYQQLVRDELELLYDVKS